MVPYLRVLAVYNKNYCSKDLALFAHFRKRHRGWSNTRAIGVLDRGSLNKAAQKKCPLKTTKKVRKANGKVQFQGIKGALKSTQSAS